MICFILPQRISHLFSVPFSWKPWMHWGGRVGWEFGIVLINGDQAGHSFIKIGLKFFSVVDTFIWLFAGWREDSSAQSLQANSCCTSHRMIPEQVNLHLLMSILSTDFAKQHADQSHLSPFKTEVFAFPWQGVRGQQFRSSTPQKNKIPLKNHRTPACLYSEAFVCVEDQCFDTMSLHSFSNATLLPWVTTWAFRLMPLSRQCTLDEPTCDPQETRYFYVWREACQVFLRHGYLDFCCKAFQSAHARTSVRTEHCQSSDIP